MGSRSSKRGQGTNTKGRSKKRLGKFVGLGHLMVTSLAFRSLGGRALKYYVELRDRFNGTNNGYLHLSCDEAARLLHMSKATAMRAQRELGEKGFIISTKPGNWYARQAAEWALTDNPWMRNLPTNAWKNWRPK
jgi:hypothetical protein